MSDVAQKGELLVRYLAKKKLIEEPDAARVLRRMRDASCTADPRELLLQIRMLTLDQLIVAQLALGLQDAWSIPGYRVEARVGAGAMGTVFRAVRESDGLSVALKLISERYLSKPDAVARFQRELDLARRIDCRGFPWYGDDGRSRTGQHYYTMQLVSGEDLKQRLARTGGPISEELGWKVLLQMAHVLEHLERAGILHRDIKPANILIDDELIWLCDLGLAKAENDETDLTGGDLVMGTPLYMSPEQAMGQRKLTSRTDVYSLGVALYLCTTGKPPFNGETAVVVMRQHVEAAPLPPRDLRPELSREWSDAVLAMLAKKPADRPSPERLGELVDLAMRARADDVMRPDATPSRPLDLATIAAMPSLGARRPSSSGKAGRSGASGAGVAREGNPVRPTAEEAGARSPTRGKTTARHRAGAARRPPLRAGHWVAAAAIAVGVALAVLLVTGVFDQSALPGPPGPAPASGQGSLGISAPAGSGATITPASGSGESTSGSGTGSGSAHGGLSGSGSGTAAGSGVGPGSGSDSAGGPGSEAGSGSGSAEVAAPADWLSRRALSRREGGARLTLDAAGLAPHASWRRMAFDGRSLDRGAAPAALAAGVAGVRIDVGSGALLPVRCNGVTELSFSWTAQSTKIVDWPGMVVVAGNLLLELGHVQGASRTHRMAWMDGDRASPRAHVIELPIEFLDIVDQPHTLSLRVADGKVRATVTCEGASWELALDGAVGAGGLGFAARGKSGWVLLRELTLDAGEIEPTDRGRD